VYAQNSVTLEVKADEEVIVVKKDGTREITYIKPESVVPGDVIRYGIFYNNLSKEVAEAVVITNPIPKEMEYLNESASGLETTLFFSIDDAKTFDLPENLMITDKYGNKRLATSKEYTHVQWRFNKPLPPKEQGAVYYRTKLK
jgi:uncharacterized repeat protein (TIGR01451 family)